METLLNKIGRLMTTHRLWLAVSAVWFILAAGMLAFAPSLTEVGVMNEASFLPENSGYLQAKEILREKFPDRVAEGQGLLVFYDPQGLDDEDREYARSLVQWLTTSPEAPAEVERVVSIFDKPELEEMLVSDDGQAMLMQVDFSTADYSPQTNEAVEAIRAHVASTLPSGMDVYITGPAAMGRDIMAAVLESTDKTTVATIVLVIVVLLIVYRSPVASLVPLITIATAYVVARGILGFLAQEGMEISSLLDSLLIVLIFGVGTDYALFLISRFREEVGRDNGRVEALVRTVSKIGPVITASAGTVIVGLLGMMVASFGMTRTTGPAMALSIAITLLASLSLTPALLHLFGRRLFWPFHRRLAHERIGEGLINWKKIGRLVTSRPLLTAVVVLGLLLAPYPAWSQMNSTFNILGEIPEDMEAAKGFNVLEEHFAAGEMAPLTVIVTSSHGRWLEPDALHDIARMTDALESVEGVDVVRSVIQPDGNPETRKMFRADGQLTTMAEQVHDMLDALEDPTRLGDLMQDDQDPTEAFSMLRDYLDELGETFHEVRDEAAYRDAVATLDDLSGQMDEMIAQARVDGQLATMAEQMEAMGPLLADPQALLQAGANGEDPSAAFAMLRGYLEELGETFPEVQEESAYRDALESLDELQQAMEAAQKQMLVTAQLGMLAAQMQQAGQTMAKPQALAAMGAEGENPFAGLQLLGDYLLGLGEAYPELQNNPAYQDAMARMQQIQMALAPLQEQASVSNQMGMLATQLQGMEQMLADPQALAQAGAAEGQSPAESASALKGYLEELGEAFPDLKDNAAYADALERAGKIADALTRMEQAQAAGSSLPPEQMQAALTALQKDVAVLLNDVETLRTVFADRPEAVFFPTSMPLPPEALTGLQRVGEEMGGLAEDLQALAGTFAAENPTATYVSPALLNAPQAQAAMEQTRATLTRFTDALKSLSDHFSERAVYFIPTSLVTQEETAAAMEGTKAELTTFADDLEALADFFADREAYFIPQTMLERTPELSELLDYFIAEDHTATQLTVLLDGDPYSLEAMDVVDAIHGQLDETLASINGGESGDLEAYVGGLTLMAHDVQRTVGRDFSKVQAVVVAGVFLIFILLLRSLVAPIYLVLSVILSYGTTMGLSTLLFQDLLGYEGVNYVIPIIIFVLLVALGADYNIFLMSRVKEESEKHKDVREGIRLASAYTGSIITSCGIILAGTFAALTVSPIKMLFQIGVAIAIGVLVDTFIVRTLLVPSIATLLGRWNWWPSRISED